MTRCAATIDRRLLRVLARTDDPRQPIAETNRAVGAQAARLGMPRPSYERVRVLVHELRLRRKLQAEARGVLLEVALRGEAVLRARPAFERHRPRSAALTRRAPVRFSVPSKLQLVTCAGIGFVLGARVLKRELRARDP